MGSTNLRQAYCFHIIGNIKIIFAIYAAFHKTFLGLSLFHFKVWRQFLVLFFVHNSLILPENQTTHSSYHLVLKMLGSQRHIKCSDHTGTLMSHRPDAVSRRKQEKEQMDIIAIHHSTVTSRSHMLCINNPSPPRLF